MEHGTTVIDRETSEVRLPVTFEQAQQVCEILGLNPNTCTSLTIDAGFPITATVTVLMDA